MRVKEEKMRPWLLMRKSVKEKGIEMGKYKCLLLFVYLSRSVHAPIIMSMQGSRYCLSTVFR